MARQYKSFVSGTIGNIIFYEFRGIPVARTKPVKVRLTKATKASAKEFGRAARYSKLIRQELAPMVTLDQDRSLMYRLNSALLKWLIQSKGDNKLLTENIERLVNFQLNENVPYGRRLKFTPVVHFDNPGMVSVTLPSINPAKDIKAPTSTRIIELNLFAVRCSSNDELENHQLPFQNRIIVEIECKDEILSSQTIEIPFNFIKKDIVVVALRLNFITLEGRNRVPVTDKKWLTGKIIGAKWIE